MKTKKNKITSIGCEEAVRHFDDFISNYLKGRAREELVHHIKNCSHCFDRLEFEQMLKAKISLIGKTACIDENAAKKHVEKVLSKIYMA